MRQRRANWSRARENARQYGDERNAIMRAYGEGDQRAREERDERQEQASLDGDGLQYADAGHETKTPGGQGAGGNGHELA